jgi:hypothetical protein
MCHLWHSFKSGLSRSLGGFCALFAGVLLIFLGLAPFGTFIALKEEATG